MWGGSRVTAMPVQQEATGTAAGEVIFDAPVEGEERALGSSIRSYYFRIIS
jgi:hypothetical protein